MKTIPLHSLVVIVGPSGAGKSTVATDLFAPHEIISSDQIRAQLTGDFRTQTANDEVFAELRRRVELMVSMGQRAVVDATNLKARDRLPYVEIAKRYQIKLYYLVVDRPLEQKLSTGGWRLSVNGLIEKHDETFNSNRKAIEQGDSVATVIYHTELFKVVKRSDVHDAVKDFDRVMVVGDIHGNYEDAVALSNQADSNNAFTIYLGDVIDYGDRNLDAFNLVYNRVMSGHALMVWGNHERKLDTWIRAEFGKGYRGKVGHGMNKTLSEIAALADNKVFAAKWRALETISRQHYVLDDLLFTHGAATAEMWNIDSHRLNGVHGQLAFFGQVHDTEPFREDGYPNRVYNWTDWIAAGKTVVVGHDIRSTEDPVVVKNNNGGTAIFLDTGSGKGGKLSHIVF